MSFARVNNDVLHVAPPKFRVSLERQRHNRRRHWRRGRGARVGRGALVTQIGRHYLLFGLIARRVRGGQCRRAGFGVPRNGLLLRGGRDRDGVDRVDVAVTVAVVFVPTPVARRPDINRTTSITSLSNQWDV